MCCVVCAVSWATWLLFTGVPARCLVLRLRCPGPPGSCSPVCWIGVLCCVCCVLGHLAPVHRCARSACCVACAVSWATWLLFTGVHARHDVLRVRCPRPLGSCRPLFSLDALCCVCGVLGYLAPVHRCARSPPCVVRAMPWATWLLFTDMLDRCVLLRVRCPGPLGSCSPVCALGVLYCVCGVLGHLPPVHRCTHRVLCCVCGLLGQLAPVTGCARSACCVVCAMSWATWLLFTGVPAWFVLLRVRCPGPLGSSSPVCSLSVLCCVCGVLGHLAPVHQCTGFVCSVACAVSWATWALFAGVLDRCVVLCVPCSRPLGSCSPVRTLGVLCRLCGVLGHLAPVDRCAHSMRCFVCAVSLANWLHFTGVPARCLVLSVCCPGPFGSCSPVRSIGVLCCLCGVVGHLAPVHRCTRSACCIACALSSASWLLFTGAHAPCVVLRMRSPGPFGSCYRVCTLGVLCCVCDILGHLAPVHQCAHWVCFVACAGRYCRAGTRLSGQRFLLAGRGWLPSGRALVHPDSGCFVAGRGLVRCRMRTRPSGRRMVLPGTCSRAVVGCVLCALSGFAAPGGCCCLAPVRVPRLWPAACLSGMPCGPTWCAAPHPVRSLSGLWSAFPTPWCLSPPRGLSAQELLGGWAGHMETGREFCLPLAPAQARALGSLRVVPVRGPAMGLSLAGPSNVGLGLRVLRWFACVDPVGDASRFRYRLSLDGGLHRCTGAVSCGRQHLLLRVGGRHARVACVFAC